MASLKDIAAACGVSVATVSKSLGNHTDISAATRERVRKMAEEMGYLPNISARYLKTNRSYNIGVLFEDASGNGLTHDFFSEVLQSLKNEAEMAGYDVTFLNTRVKSMSYVERARYRGLDGVAIACTDWKDENVQKLLESDLKIVTIDHVSDRHTAVLSDNKDGISSLIRYICSMGHRKIAFITGEDTRVTGIRIAAFREALRTTGLQIPEEYILHSAYRDLEKTREMTKQLLDLPDPPTCILFPDDMAAFGGIGEIYGRKLSVPGHISIAGYDGIPIARLTRPALTTFAQDTAAMGRIAARCLIRSIEEPDSYRPEVHLVSGQLLEGETVGRIRSLRG